MNSIETPNLAYPQLIQDLSKAETPYYSPQRRNDTDYWNELTFAFTHDFGTPLRHMRSYLKLLKEEIKSHTSSENSEMLCDRLSENFERLKEHQQAMIHYFEAAGRNIHAEEVELDNLVKACIVEAQEDHYLNISALLERVRIYTDSQVLREILNELLSNAAKFVKEGQMPQIHIDLYREGDRMIIDVEDKGIGFSMAHVNNLFALFKSMHSSVDYPSVGIGAGLATVSRLINRIGGNILALGTPEVGAKFRLILPFYMDSSLR